MINKLISIFKKVEEDNNTYAKEFLDFYKQCIETFPKTLKSELGNVNIKPCIKATTQSNADSYVLNFTVADLLWWQGMIENDPLYFKEPTLLKREIIHAALDVFDNLKIPDDKCREYARELIEDMASKIDFKK